jgi:peptidylprolyl isomerase
MTRAWWCLLLAAVAALAVACSSSGDNATASKTAAASNTVAATPNCAAPTVDSGVPNMKTYAAAPAMTIDPSKTYIATVKTVRGDFTITLRPDLAPKHVNSFVFLARDSYFDHVTFHRVLPGFVAQAGDQTGTGSGSPGYTLPAEFATSVPYTRGVVGMARLGNDINSAGSQWFVTLQNSTNPAGYTQLDGQYTIFGQVTSGMDVVDCLTPRDPSQNPNAAAGDKIITITIAES